MALQRKSKPGSAPPEVYSKEDAAKVQETWKKGSSTTTDTFPPTTDYKSWKEKAQRVIAKIKTSKDKAKATRAGEFESWIASFEARQQWLLDKSNGKEPVDPGAVPDDLSKAVVGKGKTLGAPPATPFTLRHQYDITMPDKSTYQYKDVISSRGDVIHPTGVNKEGTRLSSWKPKDLDALLDEAGIKEEDKRKALKRVSAQEGGFNAINTWDKGWVSVGFVQFTTGESGTYNIATLLQKAKKFPGFDTYFRGLGIDVEPGKEGSIVVVDPDTGAVKRGNAAVQAIIDDKRLTAIFEHAADNWHGYLVAQIQTAISQYWITDQTFSIEVGDRTLKGKYGDVLKSEAGRTALLDQVVQNPSRAKDRFQTGCMEIADMFDLETADKLFLFERTIILALKSRISVLDDPDLTQPPLVGDFPVPDEAKTTAAGGTATPAAPAVPV